MTEDGRLMTDDRQRKECRMMKEKGAQLESEQG